MSSKRQFKTAQGLLRGYNPHKGGDYMQHHTVEGYLHRRSSEQLQDFCGIEGVMLRVLGIAADREIDFLFSEC